MQSVHLRFPKYLFNHHQSIICLTTGLRSPLSTVFSKAGTTKRDRRVPKYKRDQLAVFVLSGPYFATLAQSRYETVNIFQGL